MKSKARMHKTLASLAGAMTATAVILHWLDPSLQAVGTPLSRDEIASLAQVAVSDSVPIKRSAWHEVEIVVNHLAGGGLALAASPNPIDAHFHVDGKGRPHRDSLWSRQVAMDDAQGVIRIQVDQAGPDESPIDPVQQVTLQYLVNSLAVAMERQSPLPFHFAQEGL